MESFAVLFDMDGLMLDTERMARAAWTRALADHGYLLDEVNYLRLVGRTVFDAEKVMRELFGMDMPYASVFKQRQRYYDEDILNNGVPIKPGLYDLLNFLEEHNIPKAVASSTPSWFVDVKLARAGLEGRFSVIVSGDQVPRGKPAPDVFLEAARRLEIPPRNCVVLEDSEAGILAASSAGMLPLMIPDLKVPAPEITALAYRVLSTLSDAIPLMRQFLEKGLPDRV